MIQFPKPDPAAPILADLARLTDWHEDAKRDPSLIAAALATYLRHYIDQRGVPLGVTLVPFKGAIG